MAFKTKINVPESWSTNLVKIIMTNIISDISRVVLARNIYPKISDESSSDNPSEKESSSNKLL